MLEDLFNEDNRTMSIVAIAVILLIITGTIMYFIRSPPPPANTEASVERPSMEYDETEELIPEPDQEPDAFEDGGPGASF